MHLTDEQLNEYLDNESKARAYVEAHLFSCVDCAARLAALQSLFHEIESLPEIALSRDLAVPALGRLSGHASLPRFLRLTVVLQCAAVMVVLILAAPFVTRFLLPYLSVLRAPSPVNLLLQIHTQWTAWLARLSQFQLPGIPEIPVFELPNLLIALVILSVSVLWLLGNGLLLRNQIK
jgi:hypothetical protein